ncbi:MAG: hypothetical protein HKO90_08585 [Flavobacteriaceae bacterium]|nr:hypothetical protein [Flavobacteriaceae bacterium]
MVLNQLSTFHGTIYAFIALFSASRNRNQPDYKLKKFTFWLAIIYAIGWVSSLLGRQFEWIDESMSAIMWNASYLTILIMIFAITIHLILYKGYPNNSNSSKKYLQKYERSNLTLDESK